MGVELGPLTVLGGTVDAVLLDNDAGLDWYDTKIKSPWLMGTYEEAISQVIHEVRT